MRGESRAPSIPHSTTHWQSTPILEATHAPLSPHAARPHQQHPTYGGASLLPETSQRWPPLSITLPALAGLLLTLNHIGGFIRFLRSLGVIDCIAIICLVATAILAAQRCQVLLQKAAQNLVVQVLEMTDSRAMLAKLTEIATLNPAPGRWLDMYYTMVDDIAGLHQENVKMRTIMSGCHHRSCCLSFVVAVLCLSELWCVCRHAG